MTPSIKEIDDVLRFDTNFRLTPSEIEVLLYRCRKEIIKLYAYEQIEAENKKLKTTK